MMVFPDQSHMNHVRDALWKRSGGGASVMVGAGFSRNAEKARPDDAHDVPLWRDLAKAMYRKLYPQDDDKSRKSATAATSASENWMRLAQEYETAFRRPGLHELIGEFVRDDDLKPGEMHSRLLRLPWRDVLTTNWDTLLERTRPSVAERAYGVVHNKGEIPLASKPRIVKLHGSLPAHFPLIITEEDYRTYPVAFGPFVNTVRQAMMETVLCLIGFSGDDPNFLHWSGWVRDNLGDSAPNIYLAGWLELSPHRRRVLEKRNVVPIDLCGHPESHAWPERLRHRNATNWLLQALEYGRPYDVSNWPTPSRRQGSQHSEPPEPVENTISNEPKDEPKVPSNEDKSANLLAAVQNLLGSWGHNREVYPGWLTLPGNKQFLFSNGTRRWEPLILRSLPDLKPVDRLNAIRELIWRKELLMEPVSQELEDAAEAVLGKIDVQKHMIDNIVVTRSDWSIIREAWLFIALALVTAARQRFDYDTFNERIGSLLSFRSDNRDVGHQIHHERCLWFINSLDYEALENQIDDWHTETNCDPIWKARKSALLFEMGRYEDGDKLSATALAAIREKPGGDLGVATLSREIWILYLRAGICGYESEVWRRWGELTPKGCNAPVEIRRYVEAIEGAEKSSKGPPFDFGVVRHPGIVISTGATEHNQWIAARRAVRLTEIVGLPPSIRGIGLASHVLGLAAVELFRYEPELATRVVLRIAGRHGDERLNSLLSRARVAAVSVELATELSQICIDTVDLALRRLADPDGSKRAVFWAQRLGVAMEALSRFSVRLAPEEAENIFVRALQWYGEREIAQDRFLEKPVQNILARSWEALPRQNQRGRVLDVLSARIVGMDGFSASSDKYPDPGHLLVDDFTAPDRSADESRWSEAVSFLVRGLCVDGEARERASLRIFWANSYNLLVNAEKSAVARALWGDDYAGHDDLPPGTGLVDWVLLLLPEPRPGVSEERFRRKWFNTGMSRIEDQLALNDILWRVGSAISGLKTYERPLTFSDREQEHLAALVARWAEAPVPRSLHVTGVSKLMHLGERASVEGAILGLQDVLLEVHLSESIAGRLYQKVQDLNESGILGLSLAAGLINVLPPCRFDDIVLSMRKGLASDDTVLAENAAEGLWFWLRVADDSTVELRPPPVDLIREIGMIIAARRKTLLVQALQIAKWVFSEGEPEHKEAIGDLASQGLGYLAQELRYDGSQDPDVDVPFLRWGCTHLALAMAQNGFGADPAVTDWVNRAESDPLPEVRNATPPFGARRDGEPSNGAPAPDRRE